MLVNRSNFFKVLALVAAIFVVSGCEPDVGLGPSVDINPPVVGITSHEQAEPVRGTIVLSGTATDDQEVKAVAITSGTETWTAAVVAGTDAKNCTWSASIGTDVLTDGTVEFIITATDKGDKTGSTVWSLNIDNKTPVVVLRTPSLSETLLNDRVLFEGTAYDNVKLASVSFTLQTTAATPVVLVGPVELENPFNWTYSLDSTSIGGGLEGDYEVVIVAADVSGNVTTHFYHDDAIYGFVGKTLDDAEIYTIENGGTVDGVSLTQTQLLLPSNNLAVNEISFPINQSTDFPVITIDDFPATGTKALEGQNITITGLVTDDDGLVPASVQVSIDGGAWVELTRKTTKPKEITWTYNPTSLADGNHTISIRANDNNTPPKTRTFGPRNFTYDSLTPPTLAVDDLATLNGSYKNGDFTVTGTVSDNAAIDGVTLNAGGTDLDAVLTQIPGTYNYTWTRTLDLDVDGLSDGSVDIEAVVTDASGKTDSAQFRVNIDTTDPTLSLTSPDIVDDQNGTFTVRGSANDNTQIASVQYSLDGGPLLPLSATKFYSWDISIDSTGYDDGFGLGDVNLRLVVTDPAGNVNDQNWTFGIDQSTDKPIIVFDNLNDAAVTAGQNALNADPVIMGTITDDDGVAGATVQVSINGGAWENASTQPPTDGAVGSWKHDLTGSAEAVYDIAVRVRDKENTDAVGDYTNPFKATTSVAVPFLIDSNPPQLTNIAPVSGLYQRLDFTLEGDVTDSMLVDYVDVAVSGLSTVRVEIDAASGHWSVPVDIDDAALAQSATIPVTITARDSSGKQISVNYQFVKDTQLPSVTLTGPSTSVDQNGLLTVRGTATDNLQIATAQYQINTAGWLSLGSIYAWEQTIDTTLYDDVAGQGSVDFSVRMTDLAGNIRIQTWTYTIDQTTDQPVISFSNLNDAATLANQNALDSDPVLFGSISDDDAVDASSIQISINGGAWDFVNDPPTIDNGVVTWAHDLTGYAEGIYSVAVRVTDDETADYGNAFKARTSVTIPFAIDSAPPELKDILPAASSYQDGDFTITGKAEDSLGVASVTVTFNGTDYPVSTSNDYLTWWLDVDTDLLTDGSYSVRVTARDDAGKQASTDFAYFVDQTDPTVPDADILPAEGTTVNGRFQIQGSASDSSAIGKVTMVEYSFGNTGTWTDISAAGLYSWKIPTFTSFNYDQYVLGTAATAGDLSSVAGMVTGDYYKVASPASYYRYDGAAWQAQATSVPWTVVFKVRVTDGAGNVTTEDRTLVVDQTTDAPVVTLSNLNVSGDADDNLLETNPRILGLVVDDDGINSGVNAQSIVEISFDYNGANEGTATWTPVTVTGTGTNISWSYNLYSGASLIPAVTEGVNNFSIRVRDIIIGTAGATGYNKTITGPVEFGIDLAPPVIAISAGSIDTGSYLNAAGGDLIFTVTEPNRSAMILEVNGSSAGIAPTANANEFELTVDTTSMSPGQNTLTIRAVDNYGKTTDKIITVTVDKVNPDISINNLTAGTVLNGDIFILAGAIDEPYGLDTSGYPITASIYEGATLRQTGTVTGSYSWTFNINMDSLIPGDTTGLADNTAYTVVLTARDMAGNVRTTAPLSFSVNQSLDVPKATLSNLAAADDGLRTATITVDHATGKEILVGVLYASSAIDTGAVTVTVGGVNRTGSVVFQGSGTIIPFHLDMSNATTYPDNVYSISMTVPGGVSYLYDVIGNNVAVVNTGTKIIGQVEDDDAVYAYSVAVDGTTVLSQSPNTGKIYNPTYTVTAGITSGIHLIRLTSTDESGLSTSSYSLLVKDTGVPGVTITAPDQGAYVNDDVSTTGSTTDDYALKRLSIMAYKADTTLIHDFGTTATWTKTDSKNWSWNFTLEALPDIYSSESVTLEYTSTDFVGSQTVKQRAITVDNVAPTGDIRYPAANETLNGSVAIRGTATDPGLDTVRVRVGYYNVSSVWVGSGWLIPDGIYNWTYTIPNIVNYANRLYSEEQFTIFGAYANTGAIPGGVLTPGRVFYLTDNNTTVQYTSGGTFQTYYDLWQSGIEVRLVDRAGNATTIFQNVKIDANSDRPIVTVIQPTASVSTQGGTVMIFGTARDDDSLLRIEAQLDVNGDNDFTDQIDLYNGSAFTYDGDTADPFEDETQWYTLTGTESWTLEFNKFGELYSRPTHLGDGGLTGVIRVKIRAVDINGVYSNEVTRTVNLDNTVPVISGTNYLSGAYVHGDITLHADLTDDALGGIKMVEVSYNNGSNWTTLYQLAPLVTDTSITINNARDFDLDLQLETTDSGSPAFIGSSDILYLVLKVTDTSNYPTLKYIYLNVDNQAPSANLKLDDPVIFNPYDINSTSARVYGHATDIGTISGLSRMIVYFTRGTTVYDVLNGNTSNMVSTTNYAAAIALNDYSVPGSEEAFAVIVNDMNEYGDDDNLNGTGDLDLIDEYITGAIGGSDWWFTFDSFNIPDGDIVIHYVVEDTAGNTAQYTQDAVIANNKPQFLTTLIGDDIDINGAVAAVEKYTYPATGTRPRIIEEMEVTVTMDKLCTFEVFYGDFDHSIRSETVVDAMSFTFNEDSLGSGNTYTAGNHLFYIRARDENDIVSIKEISVTIADTDGMAPVLQIFPLSASYTDARDSAVVSNVNSSSQMRPVLVDPESNINGVYQGHIELTDYTLNDLVNEEDADVSGIITLRGYVYDNRGLKAISGTVEGFASGSPRDLDADGNTTDPYEANVLAYWDTATGRLVSNVTNFGTDYELFTITTVSVGNPFSTENQGLNQNGHILYWTYKIDTSRISGQAASDTGIEFVGIDFYNQVSTLGATPFTNETDGNEQIDVVPYVTGIERAAPFATIRSRYGAYPVRQGETGLMINGYNLNTGGYIRTSANKTGALGTYTNFTGYTVNGTFTRLTVDVPAAAKSGWLRLVVNSTEAINNLNEPTLASNKEVTPSAALDGSTDWTDDRYLHVWTSGNSNTSDYFNDSVTGDARGDEALTPKYPAMSIDPEDDTLYASWSHYGASRVFYKAMGNSEPITVFRMYDPPEHTDISLNATGDPAIVYNANYWGGGDWNETDAGGVNVWNPSAPYQYTSSGVNCYFHRFECLYHDTKLMQFTNQRIVRNGNRYYITWYDTDVSALKYGSRLTTSTTTGELGIINIDGGQDANNGNETFVAAGRSASAGEFSAVDVDEQGFPVIAYYDITNQTIKIARTGTATPAAGNWTLQTVFLGDDPNRQFTGKHISMKIDSSGVMHIVSYNTANGDLIYIKSTNDPDDGAAYAFANHSVKIDQIGSVGTGLDLTLDGTTPYVSYLDTSRLNSFSGLKMAFYDSVRGDWEYMNVPLVYEVLDSRTSTEHRRQTGTAWKLAIGYLSADYYRVAYYQPTP
jgi:hypothetical protein